MTEATARPRRGFWRWLGRYLLRLAIPIFVVVGALWALPAFRGWVWLNNTYLLNQDPLSGLGMWARDGIFWILVGAEVVIMAHLLYLLGWRVWRRNKSRVANAAERTKTNYGRRSKGDMHRAARLSTLVLIVLMIGTPYLRLLIGDDGMHWTALLVWIVVFVLYYNFQTWETVEREISDRRGYLADSAGAIAGLLVSGIMLALWMVVAIFDVAIFEPLRFEEIQILGMLIVANTMDLVWGILISQRIAGSQKERDESQGH
ncbi:hypothetical protein COU18_03770 [Candidatus Kaiserbacteria bacterium CG10_big_fil_rev_8_21_14_0_10_51_14]|uniref:Uncharacterized protein n=1 Tax=Candidatus Kaiserbacteria bacterium CG10_big_fil_rev_8_21_14_0_10_51_14 TaxID=1974610 RepID=A0A2H0UBI3_9BACT|nr:MAG: hypothetical protein COU18_03770 [Candidatus Kaiserbacteria bacterium CG10_big_fil_rev_8_21_14_0_10_51_14]